MMTVQLQLELCVGVVCTLVLLPMHSDAWTMTATASESTSDRCPTNWSESGDSCYKVFVFNQPYDVTSSSVTVSPHGERGWKRARLSCMVQGSDLVSINTAGEAHQVDIIRRNTGVDDSHFYWVGLEDTQTEASFRWVDGSNVTFSRWKVGEPTSFVHHNPRARDEDYVLALGSTEWMDVKDDWTRITPGCLEPYAYICEKPLTTPQQVLEADTAGRRITRILGLAGSSGAKGEMGQKGDRGNPGAVGPPGEKGESGVNGRPGAIGQTGVKGDPGQMGAPGPQGRHGPPGMIQVMDTLIGPNGARGEQGPQGPVGEPGPRGITGQKGHRGEMGYVGATGLQGPKGARGGMGRQGLQGQRGMLGPQGPTGAPGLTGRPGLRGLVGPEGVKGTAGLKGTKGTQGLEGAEGPTGSTGLMGPRGPMGVQGLTGIPGIKGEVGANGDTGLPGVTGPKGGHGEQGEPGMPGYDGVPGVPGAIGPIGPQGIKGEAGRHGQNGIPGMPGTDGFHGPKGDPGTMGLRGHTGPPGPPGPVPSDITVEGATTYSTGGPPRKAIFVNATAFCRGRRTGAYPHPLHCWQFMTCGALYGGEMEHTCYSGRRFDLSGPECKKDHSCVFGAPSVKNEESPESSGNRMLAALALKEGDTRFAKRSIVDKLRAAHSVYSAGMVVIFVLLAIMAVLVLRLHLTRGRQTTLPPLIIEKHGSVI